MRSVAVLHPADDVDIHARVAILHRSAKQCVRVATLHSVAVLHPADDVDIHARVAI